MHLTEREISALIFKSIRNELTGQDVAILDRWIASDPANKAFFDRMSDPGYLLQGLRDIAKCDCARIDQKFQLRKALLDRKN